MNKNKTIILAVVILVIGFVLGSSNVVSLGGVPKAPSYNSASSTAYTIGHQVSIQVLSQAGGRGYASFCNSSANDAYLVFGSTAVTATSSSDVAVFPDTCYEINDQNLYTGAVLAIQDAGTTTASLLVTELTGY